MRRRRELSPQALSVLAALREETSGWQYGYALARATGLKSGSLYPILIRLHDQGLVEASWEDSDLPGRPRRHLYRLTAGGLAAAAVAPAAARQRAGQPAVSRGSLGGRGVAAPASR